MLENRVGIWKLTRSKKVQIQQKIIVDISRKDGDLTKKVLICKISSTKICWFAKRKKVLIWLKPTKRKRCRIEGKRSYWKDPGPQDIQEFKGFASYSLRGPGSLLCTPWILQGDIEEGKFHICLWPPASGQAESKALTSLSSYELFKYQYSKKVLIC